MAEWNYAAWAEAPSNENLKHRLATGDLLLTQANSLLTLILVGIGGSVSYAIKVFDPGAAAPQVWGAVAAAIWLIWIGVVVVFECIATRNTDVPGNEPDGIFFPAECITELQARTFQLQSVQRRINSTKARNSAVAWWLDRCRYAALTTPLIFVLVTLWVTR